MTTIINANGSKWAGQEPEPLQAWLDRLRWCTLDPRFEDMGNFVMQAKDGMTRFWGNFLDVSAVFDILTDDYSLIRMALHSIRLNQESEPYQRAKAERTGQRAAA